MKKTTSGAAIKTNSEPSKRYQAPRVRIRCYVPFAAVMQISGTGSGEDWEDPGDD